MIRPLIWKEWHEQRWKLFFGTVMLAFFTGSMIAARWTTDREVIIVVWILGGLVLALYSAMGVFAMEITDRTKAFLFAKPIQSWKTFLCKWFFGWLNFAAPMLICSAALAMLTLAHPENRLFEFRYIIKGTFAGVCFGTMFYSMTCCFAPLRSSEALVGFTGLAVFFIFLLHIMVTQYVMSSAYSHGFSFFEESVLYLNPMHWVNLMKPIRLEMHYGLLTIEQAILFSITILIGLRKWQRSM